MWFNAQLTYQCDIELVSSISTCDYHLTNEPWWPHNYQCTIVIHLAELSVGKVERPHKPRSTRLWPFIIEQTGQADSWSAGLKRIRGSEIEDILTSTHWSWRNLIINIET